MKLSKELGLMFYRGEGDKTGNYFIALTNTDSKVLVYYVSWLRKYFNVNEAKLKGNIWKNINENKAKKHWSKESGIPINQFTKPYISKSIPKIALLL